MMKMPSANKIFPRWLTLGNLIKLILAIGLIRYVQRDPNLAIAQVKAVAFGLWDLGGTVATGFAAVFSAIASATATR